ncbi:MULTISPECIES: MFS transporter [Paenibacillus]|uniref:MFS transporter n=1 Tax=Paenibacillus TaxID=44249 RepID=UPI00096CC9C9|nr:glycoside-pentoside-hexuronide (GPH):cation symporter [Paenibacillus peoriae]OMF70379.1 H+-glucitol symporter [Paenibacillus peoriae]OMF81308.1 H+-glucitol symporter [Paenibacillus peoriae]
MQATEVKNQFDSILQEEDRKLTFREKVAASLGGGIGTLHSQMIAMFLLFFYTDVMEISPAFVAGLFLVARIISAVLVPLFGVFIDKVITPWGKYVPWLMLLGVPTAIFGWLIFTDFNLSPTGKIIYVSVTYLLYSIFSAAQQAPGNAVGPAITKRVDDRISMGQIGFFFIMIGAIVVSLGAQPLYKALGGGNDAKGFSMLMGAIAVIGILASVFQVKSLKERYIAEPKKEEKKHSLKEMFLATFTNKAAVIIYVYVLAITLSKGIRDAIMIDYLKYYFHNENLLVAMGFISLVPAIIGSMLAAPITKRIGIRANILTSVIMSVVTSAAIMFVPASSTGVTIFLVLRAIDGFFMGISTPPQSTMMPAAMDYTEWKTGMNVNGFMGSIQGVMTTIATAIAGSLTAGALALVGYVPGVEQSSETILGLKMLVGVIPAFVLLFAASVAWFDLTEEKQVQIAKDLAERRKQNA